MARSASDTQLRTSRDAGGRGAAGDPHSRSDDESLEQMLMSDETSVQDVVEKVSSDRILVRRIIKEAARREKHRTGAMFQLTRAIQVLGFRRLKNLLASRAQAS